MCSRKKFFPSSYKEILCAYFPIRKVRHKLCSGRDVLFHEHEYDGKDYEKETDCVIPLKPLAVEHERDDEGKDNERRNFLNHLQLEERERAAVDVGADTIGGHQEAVLNESHSPRSDNYEEKGPACRHVHLLEFQVSIPCKGHKTI